MKKIKAVAVKPAMILLLMLFLTIGTRAQEVHGEPDVWFLLLNHYELNDTWAVGNELHIRRTEWLNDSEQFLLRPFVNYKPGKNVTYTAGYTYIRTYPYGEYPLPISKPEHNIWEQVTVSQQLGKTRLLHRYRVEHRYQGILDQTSQGGPFVVNGYDFTNRFRYRLTLRKPIDETFFIHLFDEVWVKTDGKFKEARYDRNWIYLGLGMNVLGSGNIQAAYLWQHIRNNATRVETHPTVQFTFQYDFKSK